MPRHEFIGIPCLLLLTIPANIAGAALDTKLSDQPIWRIGANYTFENQRSPHDTSLAGSVAVKFQSEVRSPPPYFPERNNG